MKNENNYNLLLNNNKNLETNEVCIKDEFKNSNSILNEENKINDNEIILLNNNKELEKNKIFKNFTNLND